MNLGRCSPLRKPGNMSAGSIVFLLAVVFGLILIVGFMAVHSIDGKLSEIIKILKEKK